MTKERKNTLQLLSSVILVMLGCILVFMGFFVPPMGEISPSVLAAFGEILTFAGAIIGVDYNYKFKSEHDSRHKDNQ